MNAPSGDQLWGEVSFGFFEASKNRPGGGTHAGLRIVALGAS